jgi:hypothetical protein
MEQFLRKLLQKVGSRADGFVSKKGLGLKPEVLIPALYEAIEQNVAQDQAGVRRVAPGQISIALNYEIHSQLDSDTLDVFRREVLETVRSYIRDHRYLLKAKLAVEVLCDPFLEKAFEIRIPQQTSPDTALKRALLRRDGRMIPLHFGEPDHPRRLTLGRTKDNEISLDDPSISRFHAAITLNQTGDVVVSDLGSANGTFINGCRIGATAVLHQDDELVVGNVSFKLVEG